MKKIGVVEDRLDPLKLGRCKVRIFRFHTDNKTELPTSDLPWAIPQQPITSAAMSGIGIAPVGPVEGTWVTVEFLDEDTDCQYPIITGTIAGIPGLTTNISDVESFDDPLATQVDEQNTAAVTTGSGGIAVDSSGKAIVTETLPSDLFIANLTREDVDKLKEAIAKAESQGSGGYKAINSLGYLGKYQFGSLALQDMGYVVKGTSAASKVLSDPSKWTGKNDVKSREDFLANQTVQEEVMDLYLKRSNGTMTNRGYLDSNTPKEKRAGLLAVAHLKGIGKGGVKDYLAGNDIPDAYGSKPSKYYNIGYNSILGKPTAELPTIENLSKPAVDKNITQQNTNKKYDVPPTSNPPPQQGFVDPNGKYPLKSYLNEADTSRLARGSKISNTIVGEKEEERETGIPIANGGTWNQPPIPYNARYPFNHVTETETGHVMEFDDTPGAERINIHHRAGTFTEIDSMGNQVNKVAGIRTIIIEKNDLVYIKGSGHINVDGDISIRAGNDCQIQVLGNANVNVSGSVTQSIGGNYSIVAGGNISFDGASIFLNSGAAEGASSYSPTIEEINPPTRQEIFDMLTEDTPKPKDASAPPVTEKAKDTTKPLDVIPVSGDCNFIELSYQTRLSTNYTLHELCNKGAHPFPFGKGQHGLTDKELACNLKQLAINVIEPLRAKYANLGFMFTNTFREAGSKISKSGRISQHELGMAGDFAFTKFGRDRQKYFDLAKEIKDTVPFDQLLLETRSSGSVWIHISFKLTGNRKQILTLHDDKTVGSGLILVG